MIAGKKSSKSHPVKRHGSTKAPTAAASVKTLNTGRPRSETSRIALLETAYDLMKTEPLAEISTHQIAAKAGVSTATVYRWWPTKQALLVDAFLHAKTQNVPLPDTGSPLQRIREQSIAAGKFLQGQDGWLQRACLLQSRTILNCRNTFRKGSTFHTPVS